MKIIGITGPTGAGKSMLSESLAHKQIPVIDADRVYHSLLIPPSPCLDALRLSFGDGIFHGDGTLNRPALSEIVFSDEEKLHLLNQTVLGMVLEKIRKQICEFDRQGKQVVAVDAPTLIESGFDGECDVVVSVLAPADLRLQRIMARDQLSEERARLRIQGQKDDEFYRSHSHYVLINDGDRSRLETDLQHLMTDLL